MILLNNHKVIFGRFPNNESNLNFNKLHVDEHNQVILKYETDQDLFDLYILKNYLDAQNVDRINLEILYMPYSRMDRPNEFYTFNLKYVCKFINDLKFSWVKVYEAHSDITLGLLDRCDHESPAALLFNELLDEEELCTDEIVIMFPDAGAEKRYSKTFCYPAVVGQKSRNFSDGSITDLKITGADVANKKVIIIDDLCSKGGTFIAASKAVKALGATEVYLVVTHCENTVFTGELFDHIDGLYTTNSIIDEKLAKQSSKIHITKLYEESTDVY